MSDPGASDVIVVGGGFAGLYAAKTASHHGLDVTLIDANGYQTFQPLLYQAATGLLPQEVIRYELADLADVQAVTGRVASIDLAQGAVTLDDGRTFTAHSLVLATGATVAFFGVDGAAEHALPLYTAEDAEAIKARLRQLVVSGAPLDVVVVGAGATGVEVAGAICDVIDGVLHRTFPAFAAASAHVHVVDHAPAPLAHMTTESQAYAARTLESSGVTLHMGATVSSVSANAVTLADGTVLDAALTIWAGGLTATTPVLTPPPPIGHGGRVIVGTDLRIAGYEHVYVIGDASADATTPLPQLGAVAKQQGVHVGHSLGRQRAGKEPESFEYRDMGDMAMVRHDHAVVEMGGKRTEVEGDAAFAMWLGVHASLLPDDVHRREAIEVWIHEMKSGTSRFLAT